MSSRSLEIRRRMQFNVACAGGKLEDVRAQLADTATKMLVTTADPTGLTPLHHAAAMGHVPVVELLLANGADVNAVNPTNGMTPLHVAALNGHVATIAALVRRGADVNLRCKAGKRAAEYGAEVGSLGAESTLTVFAGRSPTTAAAAATTTGVGSPSRSASSTPTKTTTTQAVAAPEPDVPGGTYAEPLELHFSCATPGAVVFATFTDSQPATRGLRLDPGASFLVRAKPLPHAKGFTTVLAELDNFSRVTAADRAKAATTSSSTRGGRGERGERGGRGGRGGGGGRTPGADGDENPDAENPEGGATPASSSSSSSSKFATTLVTLPPTPVPLAGGRPAMRGRTVFVRSVAFEPATKRWSDVTITGYRLLSPVEQFFDTLPEALRRWEGRFLSFRLTSLKLLMESERSVLHGAFSQMGIPFDEADEIVKALKAAWRLGKFRSAVAFAEERFGWTGDAGDDEASLAATLADSEFSDPRRRTRSISPTRDRSPSPTGAGEDVDAGGGEPGLESPLRTTTEPDARAEVGTGAGAVGVSSGSSSPGGGAATPVRSSGSGVRSSTAAVARG